MHEPHSLRSRGKADDDGHGALSRTVLFPIRLTAAERATLGELAGERGVTVAAFVRAAALGSYTPPRPMPRPVPSINREAYWHLGQVGNNLNQIARRLNMADGDGPTLAEVQRGLEELRGLVQQVRLQLFGWAESEGQ